MRDWQQELDNRVEFVRHVIDSANAKGVIYGNSGGKDCTLVSIICKKACDNTMGIIMPCASKRNYTDDMFDALAVAQQFGIANITVDLTQTRQALLDRLDVATITNNALSNIAPRLRMTTLYCVAQSMGSLVAGTGNASEMYMGYFTKWGDGAYDFNCIADLTVTEIYQFLAFLGVPQSIIVKKPSAGLFEGQTDESEMGVTYEDIDTHIFGGQVDESSLNIINRYHTSTQHKRRMPICYGADWKSK
ncbi:MAG: NAD(+) synthase [Clostridia bacterium]|nr:NAD(+) synthase [Clostridia bacterium]